MNPAYSIVIPVHKYNDHFLSMLNSLDKVFQNPNSECLLILNGDALKSSEEIRKVSFGHNPSIKVYELKENSLPDILNFGLEKSQNEIIIRMDSDDMMNPNRAPRLAEELFSNSEVTLVFSHVEIIDEKGTPQGIVKFAEESEKIKSRLRFGNAIPHPAVAYRRSDVLKAGGYRDLYPYAEDYDLWRRLEAFGKFKCIPEVLLRYRIHGTQISSKNIRDQDVATLDIVLEQEILNGNLIEAIDLTKSSKASPLLKRKLLAIAGIKSSRGYFPLSVKGFEVYTEVLLRRFVARKPGIDWQGMRYFFTAALLNPKILIIKLATLRRK